MPLRIPGASQFSLDRYYPGTRNRLALQAVESFATGTFANLLVITGKTKSGKTHLLKGLYHGWKGAGEAIYCIASQLSGEKGDLSAPFVAQEKKGLVCIDDLDAPGVSLEEYDRVFALFNSHVAQGGYLAITMRSTPARNPALPDYLSSRLLSGMVVSVFVPVEEERKEILKKIAADRNISLSPQAIKYILSRSARSVESLLDLIDRVELNLNPGKERIGLQLIKRVINSSIE